MARTDTIIIDRDTQMVVSKATYVPSSTAIERVARLIWMLESGQPYDWNRYIDRYRQRARQAVTEPEGYVLAAEPMFPQDPVE